jgi:hypothetical protein
MGVMQYDGFCFLRILLHLSPPSFGEPIKIDFSPTYTQYDARYSNFKIGVGHYTDGGYIDMPLRGASGIIEVGNH